MFSLGENLLWKHALGVLESRCVVGEWGGWGYQVSMQELKAISLKVLAASEIAWREGFFLPSLFLTSFWMSSRGTGLRPPGWFLRAKHIALFLSSIWVLSRSAITTTEDGRMQIRQIGKFKSWGKNYEMQKSWELQTTPGKQHSKFLQWVTCLLHSLLHSLELFPCNPFLILASPSDDAK